MSAIVRFWLARCFAVRRLGMAMAARMPMMATTTRPTTTTITTTIAGLVAFVPAGGREARLRGGCESQCGHGRISGAVPPLLRSHAGHPRSLHEDRVAGTGGFADHRDARSFRV